jgi:Cu-Zn family superoxide dismutase
MVDNNKIYAICQLRADQNSGVNGIVKLLQEGDTTKIKATISGLKKGNHGFHIHEFGNLTQGCVSAGGHYNPSGKTHGGPKDQERHVGDLGNIYAEGDKDAVLELTD